MNLILFEPAEIDTPLNRGDSRAIHLLEVLRRKEGDLFDAGIVNGRRGKGRIETISPRSIAITLFLDHAPDLLSPISLIIGMSRPQTARKILQDATSLGVESIHFVACEKSEPGYAQSKLWETGEWRRHLVAGAEQAFVTVIPRVTFHESFLEAITNRTGSKIALDNYEAAIPLHEVPLLKGSSTLAFGPERGWSPSERKSLRENQFLLAHLGSRVLRTETACVAALSIIKAKLGF